MQLPRQDHYEIALRLAQEEFRQADVADRCAQSGATYRPEEQVLEVPFLSRLVTIHLPELEFSAEGAAVALRDRILILHYLNTATGAPPAGEWITFAQIPGGEFYLPAFRQRSIDRLVAVYGSQPERLVEAARPLNGHKSAYGDVGVTIPVFPRVALTFVLWRGDEEIGPAGNVLFDSTITDYLPPEDIAVVAGLVVGRLCR